MYQYGGKFVVNPSGGLEAKGHPLGATGLGMHFYIASELVNFVPCDVSDTLDDIQINFVAGLAQCKPRGYLTRIHVGNTGSCITLGSGVLLLSASCVDPSFTEKVE